MVVAGSLAAFVGVFIGKHYLYKMTMDAIQTITGLLLLGIATALITGIL